MNMESLFPILRYTHIAAGTIGLIVGTLIIFLRKGDATHRRNGRIFYYAMTINAFVSLIMAVMHPNSFLFIVGVFTLYMVLSADRILHLKQLNDTTRPNVFDWFLTGSMIVFGLVFLGLGFKGIIQDNNWFGTVYIVFGLIGLLLSRGDIQYFKGKIQDKKYWLKTHLTKMMGGYIAAFTAFLVVNNKILPDLIAWLLPTVIGTFLIIKWRRES